MFGVCLCTTLMFLVSSCKTRLPPVHLPRYLHDICTSWSPSGTSRVTLRPYQESCIDSCLAALDSGCSRIGVSLPTGSGKTTVFITLLSRIPPSNLEANRSLIIVNSIELARQTANQARRLLPNISIEIEQGARHQATGVADLTIATYQTLLRPERLSKFNPSTLKAIVVDEAHHAAAISYRKILAHFDPEVGPLQSIDRTSQDTTSSLRLPIIGFSATFSRHDGLALGAVFDRIVYHRDISEMIRDEWLSTIKFTTVKAKIDLSAVTINRVTGDFNASSLGQVLNTEMANQLIVKTWLDKAGSRKTTLIFCADLAHVRDLTTSFRNAGIDARYIYSKTRASDREELIMEFRRGQFPVLINCAILTEGADIPNIDCIVIARPTKSRNVFAQMLGRGLRLSEETGKTNCLVIDFMEDICRVPDVVSLPTLLGLSIDALEGDAILSHDQTGGMEGSVSMDDALREGTCEEPDDQNKVALTLSAPTKITYLECDDPFSLTDHASGAPHVSQLSPFAWVGCGRDVYVLECLNEGFLRIDPIISASGMYEAHYTPRFQGQGGSSIFFRKRHILAADSLSAAIRGCDTYVRKAILSDKRYLQLLRTARWRALPGSDAQKDFISRRFAKSTDNGQDEDRDFSTLTKGQAANIISRLKHGAQGNYIREKKRKEAKDRAEVRKKALLDRTVVRVGPLNDVQPRTNRL